MPLFQLSRVLCILSWLALSSACNPAPKHTNADIQTQLDLIEIPEAVQLVYTLQNYNRQWIHNGRWSKEAEDIRQWATQHDYLLTPAKQHDVLLEASLESRDTAVLARQDIAFSDAVYWLAKGVYEGRGNPKIDAKWAYPQRTLSLEQFAEAWFENGIPHSLNAWLPQSKAYKQLMQAWITLRDQALPEWQPIDIPMPLTVGKSHPQIPRLRTALSAADYPSELENEQAIEVFDGKLREALLDFQSDHSLNADGMPGPNTLALLNVSPQRRRDTLALNLQRHHWMPREFAHRRIEVNLPDFRLTAYENNEVAFHMRVVIGKEQHRTQTPAFTESMKYLVINPYWNVPNGITHRELIPKITKDPDYLARNNMEIVRGWGVNAPPVSPTEVDDWSRVGYGTDADVLRIRQKPGNNNALGRIKFMLPNRFSIYLHDTPSKSLFARSRRTFSHGCMRVEDPQKLARWVLQNEPDWDAQRLQNMVQSMQWSKVDLNEHIPVYISYFTAEVVNGGLKQWPDMYARDALFLDASEQAAQILPAL